MSLALDDTGTSLQAVVRDFLATRDSLADNRARLEAPTDALPAYWPEAAKLGWFGLHIPEHLGGSGAGLAEAGVILEEFGRALVPGPLLPSLIASAIINRCGDDGQQRRWLPGLVEASMHGTIGLRRQVVGSDDHLSGDAGAVLGADGADLFVLLRGDDVVIVDAKAGGVQVTRAIGIDPAHRVARLRLDGAAAMAVFPGAREDAIAVLRTLSAADAVGGASQCVTDAVDYAKIREQFGRTIGTFQAIKHLCANMFIDAQAATAAVWDALRAGDESASSPAVAGQFHYAAAVAARLAMPSYQRCAERNIQVHGGIGFTWEHNAHLYLRRAIALAKLVPSADATDDLLRLRAAGVTREMRLKLPPGVERERIAIQARLGEISMLPESERFAAMVEARYTMPHWPKPWGLGAGAAEQIVLEQERDAAGIAFVGYGITSWVMATVIQHGTDEQRGRWVTPALRKDEVWCQLFSEPGAGSDAAAVSTRATRTEGGWLLNGQKVWTSGAHTADYGLATVRSDPDAPKHKGITVMAVDMSAPGIDIRPLRQITGARHFNEVFFTDVFVPDADVLGAVNDGWRVARSTLGNEQLGISAGAPGSEEESEEPFDLVQLFVEAGAPQRLADEVAWVEAREHACRLMNLRRIQVAVAGGEPGAEAYVTKAVIAEAAQLESLLCAELTDQDDVLLAEPGTVGSRVVLHVLRMRRKTIAGGSYEIARNVIGERLLGLPRDPLLR